MAGGRITVGLFLPGLSSALSLRSSIRTLLAFALASCVRHVPVNPAASESPRDAIVALAPEPPPVSHDVISARDGLQVGYATWYGKRFAGRMTANGERFDPNRMTAAHRSLPFGTWVEVKRVDTGETVRVRITDRGPFGHEDRIIDLSRIAAQKLGFLKEGIARVQLRIVAGP